MPHTSDTGLVYHSGGLGDFVLSLPAIFRVALANPHLSWHYWGPADRRLLLPGFRPAPAELLRSGHTLWGEAPAAEALDALGQCRLVAAFGGRAPPAWACHRGEGFLPLSSFPPATGPWVPVFQARQLDSLDVPRPRDRWIPDWRRRVAAGRTPTDIVLHPGSGDPKKNLAYAKWERVFKALRRETGLPVRLLLGPAETERGGWERLAGAADFVLESSELSDLVGALADATLFLGNDSGVAHLAGLLGIPSVVVFGPSDPRIWRPLGSRVRTIASSRACAPCTAGGSISCPQPSCVDELSAGDVVAVALSLAESSGVRRVHPPQPAQRVMRQTKSRKIS